MIVRTLDEVRGGMNDVTGDGWRSLRMLTRDDAMGFTLTYTTLEPGMDSELEYRNHLEACLCISGRMEIEDLATGAVHELGPGSMYALDRHDRHRARVLEPTVLVCVFNPALTGTETHDEHGGYAPAD
jgi:L-ectoine synthase